MKKIGGSGEAQESSFVDHGWTENMGFAKTCNLTAKAQIDGA